MALNDLWRVVARGTCQNQIVENVFWWKEAVGFVSDAAARARLQLWGTASWIASAVPLQGPEYQWTSVSTQPYGTITTGVRIDVAVSSPGIGVTACLPSEVALVTWYKTLLSGRRNQGRSYLAGVSIDSYNTNSGLWTDDTMVAAQTLADTRTLFLTEGGGGAGVMRPILTDRLRAFVHTIEFAGVNTAPRSQRRRQIGKGE